VQTLSRIVLPVDFSERSTGAARYAHSLATHFGCDLILLHVISPLQFEYGSMDISGYMLAELYQNRAAQAGQELASFLRDELAGPRVERLVLEGDTARRIVELAHEQPALIVMPTHGYGPFRRFILGSNTAKVLHDADCPVWTGVHIEDAPPGSVPPRHILCAVDLGPHSGKTLAWAAWVARQFGARLTLLHVTSAAPDAGGTPDLRDAAREELVRLQRAVDVEAKVTVEPGDPSLAICAAAARLPADVLVIGRGSAAGVFGRLRTNAYAVIRQSPCPVVSV
jgi:nucleotide-binding universal stress UspA family protein